MQLVIEESKWYRGNSSEGSRLLRKTDGKMCCLGFLSLACGLKEENILGVGFPSSVEDGSDINVPATIPESMKWILEDDEDDDNIHPDYPVEMERIIGRINDDPTITDYDRKLLLIPIFAKYDVQVTFIP